MTKESKKTFDWILALILLLALFMYGWKIWDAGNSNAFYTSAITSMTHSFKNFWYASFDPAGYITVDKPPLALWLMTISAKIFGIHGWSIVLPSVLFGVGSVALINSMVRQHFGHLSGYISSLALIFTPIFVAVSRTNNMDTTLIFFLILSLYILDKSIQKDNIWLVILSFSLIGVSFNIKMLQAFMILPAMYLFYWLAANHDWKHKTLILSIGTIALVIFSLIWPLSVDMTSADNRPYEGGSQHNSAIELAFGYNGIQRLLGQTTQINEKSSKTNNDKDYQRTINGRNNENNVTVRGGPLDDGHISPFRLIKPVLGSQISLLLIPALIGAFSSIIYYRNNKKWYHLSFKQKQLILWISWLIPVAIFLSFSGYMHPYYTIMLAPPISVLFGVGINSIYHQMGKNNIYNWHFYLFLLSIIPTICLQAVYIIYLSNKYKFISFILILLCVIFTFCLFLFNKNHKKLNIFKNFLIVLLFILPVWWSSTPTILGLSDSFPLAGPNISSSSVGESMTNINVNHKMLNYLEKNTKNSKYLFATGYSDIASPYIINTGKSIMAIGGYNGADPAMTLNNFKRLVKKGEIKYYYSNNLIPYNSQISEWIQKYGKKINNNEINTKDNDTLYDLSFIYSNKR